MKPARRLKKHSNRRNANACAGSGLNGSKPSRSSVISRPPDPCRVAWRPPIQKANRTYHASRTEDRMTGWIGIALGDVTGIGPEVTLRALACELDTDPSRYLLIGDAGHLRRLNEQLGLRLPVMPFRGSDEPGRIFIHNPSAEPLPEELTPGSPAGALAALAWLAEGARRCLRHGMDSVGTRP